MRRREMVVAGGRWAGDEEVEEELSPAQTATRQSDGMLALVLVLVLVTVVVLVVVRRPNVVLADWGWPGFADVRHHM